MRRKQLYSEREMNGCPLFVERDQLERERKRRYAMQLSWCVSVASSLSQPCEKPNRTHFRGTGNDYFGNSTIFVKMRRRSILLYYGHMRTTTVQLLENEPKSRFFGGRFP